MNIFTYFREPPSFQVWQSHPNQVSQVLITAGVDGDEYAGIATAHQLIKSYKGNIPLTIIPCVNIAGNKSNTSYNPLDGRFPKYIYPGSRWGSSSSKLMYTISRHTTGIKLWIDLHGGASDEHVNPFVWSAISGVPSVDKRTSTLLSHVPGTTLLQKCSTLTPTVPLAKKDISYIVVEAGELGQVQKKDVQYHLDTITTLLENLDSQPNLEWHPTYQNIKWHKPSPTIPSTDVLWYSSREIVTGVC